MSSRNSLRELCGKPVMHCPARLCTSASRMRCDGDDSDLAFFRAVAPEDPVGARRAVLNVGLENLGVRIIRVLNRVVFVCLETRVARVSLEELNAFYDLLEQPFLLRGLCLPKPLSVLKRSSGRHFKLVEGVRGLLKPDKREGHQPSSWSASFAAAVKSGGFFVTLPLRAWSSPRRTDAKAFGLS